MIKAELSYPARTLHLAHIQGDIDKASKNIAVMLPPQNHKKTSDIAEKISTQNRTLKYNSSYKRVSIKGGFITTGTTIKGYFVFSGEAIVTSIEINGIHSQSHI